MFEEILYGILGVILLLQGKMKSQGIVIWFQFLQDECSWQKKSTRR